MGSGAYGPSGSRAEPWPCSPCCFLQRSRYLTMQFGEVVEMVAVGAEAHGLAAQVYDEAGEVGGGDESFDVVPAGPVGVFGVAEDLAAAAGEQALRGGS